MKLETDYRKLNATIFLGLLFGSLSILTFLKTTGDTQIVWTIFLACAAFLFITIGLLINTQFYLTDDSLELTNVIRLRKKKIMLQDIQKIKSIDKEFPAAAYKNILWFFLWDKKFKRIKQLELHKRDGKIIKIDGHYIGNKDYEKLKKKLK